MKIGIDFGTSYTKIAYAGNNGKPYLFPFPGETGHTYIPTAIAYQPHNDKIWLGDDAIHKAVYANVEFYNNFKMRLPMLFPKEWEQDGWITGRSPTDVASDYFRSLLLDDKMSFEKYVGQIESAVVSVPELWYQDIKTPGPSNLLSALNNVGLSVDRLQSEPVCAAAYCAYRFMQTENKPQYPFTLLICDIGGGTFDAALCKMDSAEIHVIDHAGSGQKGLMAAGVAFDRSCMVAAYQALKKTPPILTSRTFTNLLNVFEREKINDSGEVSELMQALESLDDLADTVIYEIIDREDIYRINLRQALAAFMPIQKGIESVLENIQQKSEKQGVSIDRALLVGGFGQYPLVQHVVQRKLGMKTDDIRWIPFDPASRFYAIAQGAFLLAQGAVQAIVPYPHTLGIRARERVGGQMLNTFIPVVRAGQAKAGMLRPEFAEHSNGEQLIVRVEKYKSGELPVYIQSEGIGDLFAVANVSSLDYPPEGRYKVGFQIDTSNLVSLVFQDLSSPEEHRYEFDKIDLVPIKELGNE